MLYTVQNEKISFTVSSLGAEMMSLQGADGTQYLWQGDPAYWADRAPNLFPFIGRLTNNSYKYMGKTYPLNIHGFARTSEFTVTEQTGDSITLELTSDEKTLEQYPFAFALQITYRLRGAALDTICKVQNLSDKTMPFGIGGHPGFNVPLAEGEQFTDYELVFDTACQPDRVGFTETVYLSGQDEAYPLENGTTLALDHRLFDEDAVILKNMARGVTLRSRICGKGLHMAYPQLPYLGIWHMPKTDAPYVCIEPWSSLPSRQDVVEEFSCKSDLLQLEAGKTYETMWTITVI